MHKLKKKKCIKNVKNIFGKLFVKNKILYIKYTSN